MKMELIIAMLEEAKRAEIGPSLTYNPRIIEELCEDFIEMHAALVSISGLQHTRADGCGACVAAEKADDALEFVDPRIP